MKFRHGTLDNCHEAFDCAVVIDVLRAYSTGAWAFQVGASQIFCVSEVAQALALKEKMPDALLTGEIDGVGIEGFAFNNSTSQMSKRNLTGKTLIQRTTAGTQGLTRARRAITLLACSFLNARATAAYIRSIQPREVFFVETGVRPDGRGDEDAACADYLEALLTTQSGALPTPVVDRALNSINAKRFANPHSKDFPSADLHFVTQADIFSFIMIGERIDSDIVRLTKKQIVAP